MSMVNLWFVNWRWQGKRYPDDVISGRWDMEFDYKVESVV